jgi:hypothetical protein
LITFDNAGKLAPNSWQGALVWVRFWRLGCQEPKGVTGEGQGLAMATLFERLDEEEAVVRGELDALRVRMAAAEERLARLTITRETARALLADAPAEDPAPSGQQDAGQQPTVALVPPLAFSAPQTQPPVQQVQEPRAARTPSVGIELEAAIEKMLVLLASAGREMKVRDIAVAIGENPTDRRIETTRSRLKSLAKQGKVREGHPGWFRIAPAAAGPVGGTAVMR